MNLQQKIHCINEVNKLANFIRPQLEKFKALEGQKILKTNGSILEKYKDLFKLETCPISPIPGGHVNQEHPYYFDFQFTYSGYLRLKLCFYGGSYEDKTYYCNYEELSLYLFDMYEHNVKKFILPDIQEMLIIEEQQAYINKLKELEEEKRQLKYKIKLEESFYRYL